MLKKLLVVSFFLLCFMKVHGDEKFSSYMRQAIAEKKILGLKDSLHSVKKEVKKRARVAERVAEIDPDPTMDAPNATCINKVPYVISSPGNYKFCKDLNYTGSGAAITVAASGVIIDGQGYRLDLGGQAGTGILLQNATNVVIADMTIKNSGAPSHIQPTVPTGGLAFSGLLCQPAISGITCCQNPCTTPFCPAGGNYDFCLGGNTIHCPANPPQNMDEAVTQAQAILTTQYQNPFGTNNPFSGVGIGLQSGTQGVIIKNVIFNQVFIGIGAPQPIQDVLVNNCVGFECGNQYPLDKVGGVEGTHRGGFAAFSTFQENSSNNIRVKNCAAYTSVGQFGVYLVNVNDAEIEGCVMASSVIETAADWAETSAVVSAIFSNNIVVKNCVGFGSQIPFNFEGTNRVTVWDCITKYWTDNGFDFAYGTYCDFRRCDGSDNNGPTPVLHFDTQQAFAFVVFLATDVILQDCTGRNIIQQPTPPIFQQGIGFITFASRLKLVNCIAENCVNAGIAILFGTDTVVEDCQAIANGTGRNGFIGAYSAGFLFSGGACYLPTGRNVFVRNMAVGNGLNFTNNYSSPTNPTVFNPVVDLSNPPVTTPPSYANLEKTM